MGEEPRTTKKFPKVAIPSAPSPRRPISDDNDDPPTVPGATIALAQAVTAPSSSRAVLTLLSGVNAGQMFGLDAAESVIGRAQAAHVHLDEVGISRRHASITRADEGRFVIEDLGSTNGIFVNGRRVERIDLVDGDRLQVGPATLLRFGLVAADEEALARQLYEGSTRDALTQLYNRKYAYDRLATEVAYAHRHGSHLSVVLFDVDHFKRMNDTFGHLAGDVVLRVLAAQAQKTVRSEDVLARYGGEEFITIVRGIEHANVLILAERVRLAIERLFIPWESQTLRATVSAGVASLAECGQGAAREELIARADARLYQAKADGRNRVR